MDVGPTRICIRGHGYRQGLVLQPLTVGSAYSLPRGWGCTQRQQPDREHAGGWVVELVVAESLCSGKRAAANMGMIQSARLNGHDPYAYLKDVLTRLPTQRANEIPNYCCTGGCPSNAANSDGAPYQGLPERRKSQSLAYSSASTVNTKRQQRQAPKKSNCRCHSGPTK